MLSGRRLNIFSLKKTFSHNLNTQINTKDEFKKTKTFKILDKIYEKDEWTNINANILSKIGRDIHKKKYHPLNHLINQIKKFFYTTYVNRNGNPHFSVYEHLSPVVSIEQNFNR
jgi:phenylalanyl-tRNA synthetase alpha chain